MLDDYDFEAAQSFADLLLKDAEGDIFLRPHAAEIHRQACLYIYEVQARLQGRGHNMADYSVKSHISEQDALQSVVQNLEDQGFSAKVEGN